MKGFFGPIVARALKRFKFWIVEKEIISKTLFSMVLLLDGIPEIVGQV